MKYDVNILPADVVVLELSDTKTEDAYSFGGEVHLVGVSVSHNGDEPILLTIKDAYTGQEVHKHIHHNILNGVAIGLPPFPKSGIKEILVKVEQVGNSMPTKVYVNLYYV